MEFQSTQSAFSPSAAFSCGMPRILTHRSYSEGQDAYQLYEESGHVTFVVRVGLIPDLAISPACSDALRHTRQRLLGGPRKNPSQPREPSDENGQVKHAKAF